MNFNRIDKTFVIAEIGVNHEGDESLARAMICLAAQAGANAVKFQTYKTNQYIAIDQPERYERAKKFELSRDAFQRLAAYAIEEGLIFFSTPLHADDVNFLDNIAPIFKISSGDLTYLELIKSVSSKRKPIIISTGLGTYEEIALAVQTVEETWADVRECGGIMLMHCVASYPTSINNANIRNIRWLSDCFNLPVGYSDHTIGVNACPIAVAAGAVAIEKHFTYRRENQSFHDHHISLNPSEMKIMVERVRETESYLGNYQRTLTEDKSMLQHMRRSLGVSRDVEAGTKITNEMLTCLRPAWGFSPAELGLLVGRSLKNSLRAGSIVKDSDLN